MLVNPLYHPWEMVNIPAPVRLKHQAEGEAGMALGAKLRGCALDPLQGAQKELNKPELGGHSQIHKAQDWHSVCIQITGISRMCHCFHHKNIHSHIILRHFQNRAELKYLF